MNRLRILKEAKSQLVRGKSESSVVDFVFQNSYTGSIATRILNKILINK